MFPSETAGQLRSPAAQEGTGSKSDQRMLKGGAMIEMMPDTWFCEWLLSQGATVGQVVLLAKVAGIILGVVATLVVQRLRRRRQNRA